MDYIKKLEEAKRLYETANADQKYVLESLFPEIRESVDEKIRKGLINYFNHHKNGINIFYGIKGDDILAWLEKVIIPNHNDIDFSFIEDIKNVIDEAPLLMQSDKEKMIAWLEKLGEQKPSLFETPKTLVKDATEVSSRMQSIDDDLKPIADFIIDYASWDLRREKWNHPTPSVPLFRVLDALIQRGKPYTEG